MGRYSEALRQAAYESLTPEQQVFLDDYLKRGKKTKWLNILAQFKGVALTETSFEDESLLADALVWELIEVEDAGAVSKALRCECGKALRYRYTVRNKKTGVLYRLGHEHLQQYTSLDAQTVKAVIKGLKKIDLERDEILDKILDQWQMPFQLHPKLSIPEEVKQLLALDLPLLDRQLKYLKNQNNAFIKELSLHHKQLAKNLELEAAAREEEAKTAEHQRIRASLPPFERAVYETLCVRLSMGQLTLEEGKQLMNCVVYQQKEINEAGLSLSALTKRILDSMGRYGTQKIAVRHVLFDLLSYLGK